MHDGCTPVQSRHQDVTADDGMTMAEQTARRLILAGITWDDPGLRAIREWNATIYNRDRTP